MFRYFYISLGFLLCSLAAVAQSADTAAKELSGHQFTVGIDIFQPIINSMVSYRSGFELSADYYFKNDLYFIAEGGAGNADINYNNLKYTSSNSFFRLGINKSLFSRFNAKDWDMAFVGLRYGFASIQRSNGTYVTIDSFFGNTSGSVPAASMNCHWVEITGGMRVELVKGLCAGYTIRGKFRLNDKDFKDLAPAYIAGYGRGEKNSVFDFNLHISYAIRWRRK